MGGALRASDYVDMAREIHTKHVCDNNNSWLQQHAVDELESAPEEILHSTVVDVRGVDGALWPEAME